MPAAQSHLVAMCACLVVAGLQALKAIVPAAVPRAVVWDSSSADALRVVAEPAAGVAALDCRPANRKARCCISRGDSGKRKA